MGIRRGSRGLRDAGPPPGVSLPLASAADWLPAPGHVWPAWGVSLAPRAAGRRGPSAGSMALAPEPDGGAERTLPRAWSAPLPCSALAARPRSSAGVHPESLLPSFLLRPPPCAGPGRRCRAPWAAPPGPEIGAVVTPRFRSSLPPQRRAPEVASALLGGARRAGAPGRMGSRPVPEGGRGKLKGLHLERKFWILCGISRSLAVRISPLCH